MGIVERRREGRKKRGILRLSLPDDPCPNLEKRSKNNSNNNVHVNPVNVPILVERTLVCIRGT